MASEFQTRSHARPPVGYHGHCESHVLANVAIRTIPGSDPDNPNLFKRLAHAGMTENLIG